MRKLQKMALVGAFAAGALTLAGCQANPGVAATVGDARITENQLADATDLNPLLAQPLTPGQLLDVLVQAETVLPIARDYGIAFSSEEVDEVLKQVAAAVADATGGDPGAVTEFSDSALRAGEVILVLEQAQTTGDFPVILNESITQLIDAGVEFNPRYGSWEQGTIVPIEHEWLLTADQASEL